jgi:hypothetical protein
MRAHSRPPKLIASLTALPRDIEPMRSFANVFDLHLSKPCRMDELGSLLERKR